VRQRGCHLCAEQVDQRRVAAAGLQAHGFNDLRCHRHADVGDQQGGLQRLKRRRIDRFTPPKQATEFIQQAVPGSGDAFA
jgi:hypothetical protein